MKNLLVLLVKPAAALGLLGTIAACSPAPEQSAAVAVTPVATSASAPPATTRFNTVATIRDVMNTLIDPSADVLWNAVRFEMDAGGSREMRPETDEQWQVLREHAVAIIEGGNSLMIPGRRVAPEGATTEFPEYEYVPDEVDQKLQEDWQSWLGFAQGLQGSAELMLDAIVKRDADLLTRYGADLDGACEACHSQYWYRAESQ